MTPLSKEGGIKTVLRSLLELIGAMAGVVLTLADLLPRAISWIVARLVAVLFL